MKIINHKYFEFGVHRSGNWNWKPTPIAHLDSWHKIENGVGFKYKNWWSYYMPTTIQVFWLKLIFYITVKPELLNGNEPMRLVDFNKTHLALMDIPKGSWTDTEQSKNE